MAPDADVAPAAGEEADLVDPDAVESDEELEVVATLHGVPVSDSRGQVVLHPTREQYIDLVTELRSEGYWMCVDLCGVDYLTHHGDRGLPSVVPPERFEVVSNYLDPSRRRRIRVRVQVPESDPSIPTIFILHPSAENHERETFDMFGITFDGHPDPSRILMPEDWEGHPLRKDYAVGRIPVQFKGAKSAR